MLNQTRVSFQNRTKSDLNQKADQILKFRPKSGAIGDNADIPDRNFYTNDLSKYADIAQQVLLSNDQPFSPTGKETSPPIKLNEKDMNQSGPNEKLSSSEMNSFSKIEQDIEDFNDTKQDLKRSIKIQDETVRKSEQNASKLFKDVTL